MAAGNFPRVLARVLVYEGGKDDDKNDPGGRTYKGIIQPEWNDWLKKNGKWAIYASHDVWDASDADIAQVYWDNYWKRMHCEELPAGVDLVVFDGGVNSGVAQQAKWCQRATGVTVDGDFGPETLRALETANDNDALCENILKRRLAMLQSLRTWKYFGRGWGARVANVLKIAQDWASGSVGPDPVSVEDLGGHKKADPKDIKQPLIPVSATSVATTAGSIGTTAGGAASQIQPIASMFPEKVGAWILGVAGALTLAAIVANQISAAAQRRADAASNAATEVSIDKSADSALAPVAVNDNLPAATAQSA